MKNNKIKIIKMFPVIFTKRWIEIHGENCDEIRSKSRLFHIDVYDINGDKVYMDINQTKTKLIGFRKAEIFNNYLLLTDTRGVSFDCKLYIYPKEITVYGIASLLIIGGIISILQFFL